MRIRNIVKVGAALVVAGWRRLVRPDHPAAKDVSF